MTSYRVGNILKVKDRLVRGKKLQCLREAFFHTSVTSYRVAKILRHAREKEK